MLWESYKPARAGSCSEIPESRDFAKRPALGFLQGRPARTPPAPRRTRQVTRTGPELCNDRRMANATNEPGEARIVFPNDLISTGEAAKLLGVDRATVVRRARTGKIPVVAQLDVEAGRGGAYVFDRNEVKKGPTQDGMANNGTSGD